MKNENLLTSTYHMVESGTTEYPVHVYELSFILCLWSSYMCLIVMWVNVRDRYQKMVG